MSRKPVRRSLFKPNLNTKNARVLAELYKNHYGHEFPGGVTNARIKRTSYFARMNADHDMWSWELAPISMKSGSNRPFGSLYSVKKCVNNPNLIEEA